MPTMVMHSCVLQYYGDRRRNYFAHSSPHHTGKLTNDLTRVAGMFAALSVHLMIIRRSEDVTSRKLADYRAQICMMGLSELQDSWPAGGWILRVFTRVMEKMKMSPVIQTERRSVDASLNTSPTYMDIETTTQCQSRSAPKGTVSSEPLVSDQPIVLASESAVVTDNNSMGLINELEPGQSPQDYLSDLFSDSDYLYLGSRSQDFTSQTQIPYFGEFSTMRL
jgi:hypothetical protein